MRAPEELMLHNCTVFDGVADEPLPGAAIRIRDGRSSDYGPEPAVRARTASYFPDLDMGGAFVMAGLVNMHTHFSRSLPGPGGDMVSRLGPHALALYMASGAHRTLNSGVTTVRCVAEKDHAEFAIRDAIDAGWLQGPRIFTAGQALVCTGGHGHLGTDTLECDGADDFRRGVRRQISAGADLIKMMISGGIAGEEMAAVIQTAHAWGRKVTAHAGPAGIIEQAVRLGLDCVEHGYQLTRDVALSMAERGTSLVPTLIVTRCGDFFDSLGVPEWMQRRSLGAGPSHVESYQLALAAGVTVMLGSDMPPFQAIEGTTATVRELEHMAAYG